MSLKVFLNYRRGDFSGQAATVVGRIHDRLVPVLGEKNVFWDLDKDSLPPGVEYPDYLRAKVAESNVLLAVIGPDWERILEERVNEPEDFVRIEIETALERKIPVIPVLVNGTKMPSPKDLPGFDRWNGFSLDARGGFQQDMTNLIRFLRKLRRRHVGRRWLLGGLAAVALLAGGEAARRSLASAPEPEPSVVSLNLKRNYREGENLDLQIAIHESGYLYVGSVWADGQVYLLYPNLFNPVNGENRVEAGQLLQLPSGLPPMPGGTTVSYPLSFPDGSSADEVTEAVFAFVTAEPVDLPEGDADLGPAFRRLGVLDQTLDLNEGAALHRLVFADWTLELEETQIHFQRYVLRR